MIKRTLALMLICVLLLPTHLETIEASGMTPAKGSLYTKEYIPVTMVRNQEAPMKLSDDEAQRLREAYGLEEPDQGARQTIGDFGASFGMQELLIWTCTLSLVWIWL